MAAPSCSLIDCLDDEGEIEPERFAAFQRNVLQDMDEIDEWVDLLHEEELTERGANQKEDAKTVSSVRSKRTVKKRGTLLYRDTDGSVKTLSWDKSIWALNYLQNPQPNNSKWNEKFRKRFRMAYESFIELSIIVEGNPQFNRWKSKDAVGMKAAPIRLMLLGAFRYIGRGWTFDDIEEATGVHEETHRQFFHVFIEWGSTVLFDEWVNPPDSTVDLMNHTAEYSCAGFNGCIGSVDATHVAMERCSHWLWQSNKGFKLNAPSRTYNIVVNHRRKILSTTSGHPAGWNDKTLQLFDEFLVSLQHHGSLDDNVFWLFEYNTPEETDIQMVQYRGAWIMCDNGYLHWPTLVPPFKDWRHIRETRFSHWLESMRKDVECTFGIMKGRFRILKAGVRVHGVEKVDRIWKTCCALHNFLLDRDGLDEKWMEGELSMWETEAMANHEIDVHDRSFAMQRLLNAEDYMRYDSSGMGPGTDVTGNDDDTDIEPLQHVGGKTYERGKVNESGVRVVRELDHKYFKERLVEHFHICFMKQNIIWPSRRNRIMEEDL